MRRREMLGSASALAAGGLAAPAVAQGRRKLRLVTTWPRDFPGLGTGAERFAQRLGLATGGRLTVEVFGAGEIVPAFEAFDAVSRGDVEMYHAVEYYWADKAPGFQFFGAVPLGLTAEEHRAWLTYGGGQTLWDELAAAWNVKPLIVGSTGTQMFGWFKNEIKSLPDLLSTTIRMPGLGGEMINHLGGKAISIPAGEIIAALHTNRITAAEWVGPWNDLELGLPELAKYYYYPGLHEPGTAISLGMNKAFWESLSIEDKQIIQTAAEAEHSAMLAEYSVKNARAMEELIARGVQIRQLDRVVFRALALSAREVVQSVGEKDPQSKKIYNSFVDFRRMISRWSETGEEFYVEARSRYL